MLSNSQCIEVAENVWGWKWKGVTPEAYIKKEVLSWQGFGKTLEAMKGQDRRHTFSQKINVAITAYICGLCTKEELFEENHLAALEAVREGK